MNNTVRLAKIDDILAGVPKFQCVDGCADCCGPTLMSRLEWKRILQRLGKKSSELQVDDHMNCPMLDKTTNKCGVYDIRPAICHVFGASEHERLVCPHGRKPEKSLTKSETSLIMHEIDALGY